MSTSGAYLSAKILDGGTTVELEDNNVWKVDVEAKELDRTVGKSGGYGDQDTGIVRATITIHGFLDLATVTGGAFQFLEPDVPPGNVLVDLNLYFNRADTTPAFSFPLVSVVKSDLGGEVDGQFEWNFTGKNKGVYTSNVPS